MKRILPSLLFVCCINSAIAQTEDYYGPVTISFHGFICNRPTNDDGLGMDGVGDEVSVHFWNWGSVSNNRANYNGLSKIYGEDFLLHDRVKAGTATINGGLKAGDSYYREGVYGDNDPLILSNYAIVTTFCSQNTVIAILPTIWERDEGTFGVTPIQNFGVAANNAFNDMSIRQRFWDFRNNYTYNDADPLGYIMQGWTIGLDAKFSGLFTANKNRLASRPIGLYPTWDFSSQVLVLTPKTIKIIAEKDYGYGKGIIPVSFNEENLGNAVGHGNYILLLRVVADIKDRNANNPPPTLYSVGVKVNNAAAGEEFKFRLHSGARWDSVTIKSPNTTAAFPTKIAPGQQYVVTQISGPRTCQLTNFIGTISKDTIVTADCVLPLYKIGVSVNAIGAGERFVFSMGRGQEVTVTNANTPVYFNKKLAEGQHYSITQLSGPRTCQLLPNNGTVAKADIFIRADCGLPPSAHKIGVMLNAISAGERFEFAAGSTDQITITEAQKVVYFSGTWTTGDNFSVSQTFGPRTCTLTPNTGQMGHNDIIISADCGTISGKTSIRGKFSAPPGTKIILQLENSGIIDTLSLSLKENSTGLSSETIDFSFPRSCTVGTAYKVTVKSSPAERGCTIYANGSGSVEPASATNSVGVRCDRSYDLVSRSTDNKILSTFYESFTPVIGGMNEDEGRYAAFVTYGKDLDGSSGKYRQIFWRDRKTGITKLISKSSNGEEGNNNSLAPAISADGRSVAFESYASNLTDNDNNAVRDIFVWSEKTGTVTLVSKAKQGGTPNGESYEPTISGDGRVIAYSSQATNIILLEGVYSTPNVYVYNQDGKTEFISKDFETGKAAGGYSPSISADGNKVAFCAYTNRLVKGDTNNLWDIFLWESGKPGLKRISLTSTGGERNQGTESSSQVVAPVISGNGQFIAYATTASNMVPGDNNDLQDVFLYDISSGSVKRISTGNNNTDGNGASPAGQGERIGISYDGKWITYNTAASNLGVQKGNIILQNTQSGKIIPVTNLSNGGTARPMISNSGCYVIAGCSEKYDKRFASSGIFVFLPGN